MGNDNNGSDVNIRAEFKYAAFVYLATFAFIYLTATVVAYGLRAHHLFYPGLVAAPIVSIIVVLCFLAVRSDERIDERIYGAKHCAEEAM